MNIESGRKDTLNWNPFDLESDRTIISIDVADNLLTFDADITMSIDAKFGGGIVYRYRSLRVTNVGVEDLALFSAYDSSVKCMLK